MNKEKVIKRLNELSKSDETAVSLTNHLITLNEKLRNPDSEISEIASIIQKDPLFTATILKAANSSYFGLVKKVESVKQAVSIMGFSNVRKLFTTRVIKTAFKFKSKEKWNELWCHSLGTAVASEILAENVNKKSTEIMFTAGILHDIGSFVIYSYLPDEAERIQKFLEKDEDKRLLYAEKEILGMTHQEIGAYFAKEWNFPEIIVDCISEHHFISNSKYKEYVAIVMAANQIVKGMELGKSDNLYVAPLPKSVWAMIKVQDSDFKTIIPRIYEEFEEATKFFI